MAHYHAVLFDALLIRGDFYNADCAAETLRIEYVVKLGWMFAGVVSDKMKVSLLEPGVANMETIGYGEFQNYFTSSVTFTKAAPTMGITAHYSADVALPITNWDEYLKG